MILGTIIMVAAGIIIYIVYKIRLSAIRDFHKKYDFVNTHEIKTYKLVFYCFGVATTLAINLYGKNEMREVELDRARLGIDVEKQVMLAAHVRTGTNAARARATDEP